MGRKRKPAAGEDVDSLYRKLLGESVTFRETLATRYGPELTAFLRSLPLETLAGKRAAVRAVNGRLQSLGLCIRCPKTGLAARLVAHPGNHREIGRFQFELLGDPPPRLEGFHCWAGRLRPKWPIAFSGSRSARRIQVE